MFGAGAGAAADPEGGFSEVSRAGRSAMTRVSAATSIASAAMSALTLATDSAVSTIALVCWALARAGCMGWISGKGKSSYQRSAISVQLSAFSYQRSAIQFNSIQFNSIQFNSIALLIAER
jgi:hypothetical protein